MPLRIDVIREEFLPSCIRGRLLIDGADWCRTLERPWLDNAENTSCIPPGSYSVRLSRSPRFKRLLPELLHVPGRTAVRIHAGNAPHDSSGCILVGPEHGLVNGEPGLLPPARRTEDDLVSLLLQRLGREGTCQLNLVERPGGKA